MKQAKEEQVIEAVEKDGVLRFKWKPKWKVPIIFHTSKTFMDYLHGDVARREAYMACLYEYGRESENFWKAAKKRDELLKQGRDIRDAAYLGWAEVSKDQNSLPSNAGDFLRCPSFPRMDWQELNQNERNEIMRFWPSDEIRPLAMPDAAYLKSSFILDRFTKMGAKAKPVIENVPPGQMPKPMKLVLPILQQFESHPYFHVIFQLDFSKGETQLLNEFRQWLRLADNMARLAEFKKPRVGKTGEPLDRLKDLAAWRLFRETDNDWNAANDIANDKRKSFTTGEIAKKYKNKTAEQRKGIKVASPKPFRDAKQQDENPPNQANLFGEQADAYKAQVSASEYLAKLLPLEFPPPPGPEMQAAMDSITKLVSEK